MLDESARRAESADNGPDDDLCLAAVQRIMRQRRVPVATYRLQFGRSFTFSDARNIVPYLNQLGATDVYASPCLKAGRGSEHGYDVTDHSCLNPALGSGEDFDAFADALRSRGMGLIFDLVPNHMGISGDDNLWWTDVLENGPSSPFSPYFDIDWHPLKGGTDLENRVLLPILGEPYGRALEGQQLTLTYADGAFFIVYNDWRMPVAPRGYAEILSVRLQSLTDALGSDHPHVLELQSIITAISYLPLETDTDPDKVAERHREKQIIKQRIGRLVRASPSVTDAIEATVREYNGIRGEPRSFDVLDNLLNGQSYRLSFWKVAAEEINYRRFFDVNELAAIRMEHPKVFEATHRLVMDLVSRDQITGLRIDHADGLWDPQGYLEQVQHAALRAVCRRELTARLGSDESVREDVERNLDRWFERECDRDSRAARPLYVVVEKILSRGEELPSSWPVDGTTGYDFANLVNGLFVDADNSRAFSNLYASFTQTAPLKFGDLTNSTKKIIMLVSLASEVNELGFQLKRIANKSRLYRDFTLNSLTHAIREVIAALPVYRTYLTDRTHTIDAHDRGAVEAAVVEAARRNPRTAISVFEFVRAVLLQEYPDGASEPDRAEWMSFMMRFQQTSGPVMAKGVEDTAFYVYNRLLSLNEVGGDPERFGVSPALFHEQNIVRLRDWPRSMTGGSTHDSKRSADVRARLNVLSEIPSMWHRAIIRWSKRNRRKKFTIYGRPAPDRNDEYFLYQTLVGAWPLAPMSELDMRTFSQRVTDYAQKAIREAKVHTSWVNPNRQYDEAVAQFIDGILAGPLDAGFVSDFLPFQSYISFFGMLNSLSQTLLQLTSPGVPDIYQGNEMWNFSLVDPDNRRPVDFGRLQQALERISIGSPAVDGVAVRAVAGRRAGAAGVGTSEGKLALGRLAATLLEAWSDGAVKLHVMHRALDARRSHPVVFSEGDYCPLDARGAQAGHVVGFSRSSGSDQLLTVAPRLVVGLTRGATVFPLGPTIWGDTTIDLPGGSAGKRFRNLLTGEIVDSFVRSGAAGLAMSDVLATFPVALLRREG